MYGKEKTEGISAVVIAPAEMSSEQVQKDMAEYAAYLEHSPNVIYRIQSFEQIYGYEVILHLNGFVEAVSINSPKEEILCAHQ